MGRVVLVVAFFILTPVMLVSSLIALVSIEPKTVSRDKIVATSYTSKVGMSVYASLPSDIPSFSGNVTAADARPEIVRQYLASYGSPLTGYASDIVKLADRYGIDYRFVPAIARQESNLCKIIPPGSYNCWGWGITSVSSLGFDSYLDGIETVTRGLRRDYLDYGLVTPNEIMTKYTPSSNGSWAKGVAEFMSEME